MTILVPRNSLDGDRVSRSGLFRRGRCRTQRLEAAQGAALAEHQPGALRLGKAAERLRPEIAKIKQLAELASSGICDNKAVRRAETFELTFSKIVPPKRPVSEKEKPAQSSRATVVDPHPSRSVDFVVIGAAAR